MFTIGTNGTARQDRRRDLLPILFVLAALFMAMSWVGPARAGDTSAGAARPDAKAAANHIAATEAAVADETPTFGLPPIVLRVTDENAANRTVAFKAALVFDEEDDDRIEDSMRVSKRLLPRIMDSVITGIEGKRIANLSDPSTVDRMVLQRANLVLNPYGVVVRALRMDFLETH
jgi:hypothetical protein